MLQSGAVLRFLIRSIGWAHIAAALGMLAVAASPGLGSPAVLGAAALLFLPGPILALPRFCPRFLSHPRSMVVGLLGTLALVGLSFGAGIGSLLLASTTNGVAVVFAVAPMALLALYVSTFILPIATFYASSADAMRRQKQYHEVAKRDPSLFDHKSSVVTALECTLVRIAGLICFGAALHLSVWLFQDDPKVWNHVFGGRKTAKLLIALTAMAGVIAFPMPPRTAPLFWYPPHPKQLFSKLFCLGITAGLLYWLLPVYLDMSAYPLLHLPARPLVELAVAFRLEIAVAFVALTSLLTLVNYARGNRLPALARAEAPRPTSQALPSDVPAVARPRRPRPAAVKLPALGAAMKFYVAADWLVLRLLGLGLIGTAWLAWTLTQAGDPRAAALSWEQDPINAALVYAALGLFLAVPILLPRWIGTPWSVAGGLAKAVLLLAAAALLLTPARIAIETLTPSIYHATLLATVPLVAKAVAGVAITATVVVALFRQLGGLPNEEGEARRAPLPTAQELRDLRRARMTA